RDPAAAARLAAVRAQLTTIAEDHRLPVENLLQPDLVRRTCWRPPEDLSAEEIAAALRAGGAREWQIGLTGDALSQALKEAAQ
ncbi:MAG: ribonuclease D, partial [Actinophytocola sp.]